MFEHPLIKRNCSSTIIIRQNRKYVKRFHKKFINGGESISQQHALSPCTTSQESRSCNVCLNVSTMPRTKIKPQTANLFPRMKVHNLKQMAQTVNYLREHGLLNYDELKKKSSDATARFNDLSEQIKSAEKRMAEIAALKTHIINYSKTRDVYAAYRKSGYSKKYLAEHESDIILHKAAKKTFGDLGLEKLPTVKSLQAEYAELLTQKKAAYAEYRTARDEMKELLIHKANVEQILGKEPKNEEKKNEHERG